MSNIILTDSHNIVHWKPVTGTKGENFYMSKDEKYYISRPVFSRKGWELSRRSVIDGSCLYFYQIILFTQGCKKLCCQYPLFRQLQLVTKQFVLI